VIDFGHYSRRLERLSQSRAQTRDELGVRGVTFVYVGRLAAGKGLEYLIDAFAAVQRTSSTEASLLIIGDGDQEAELRARCASERLENVVFAGFQEDDALLALYAASDVFVFPTLGDTFGMVVVEAMASGLPVISTSAAGEINDRIDEGVNGFIVAPADADALGERMQRLALDESLRKRMGTAARSKVANQSPAVRAEAFEEADTKVVTLPSTR
jgi:glycosyltransferase involved in cell wall biosynthesis